MKVLLSSKSLLRALNELPDLNIVRVGLTVNDKPHGTVNFRLANDSMSFVDVVIMKYQRKVLFKGCPRWDWVRDLMKLVPEQPITLEIKYNAVNVIFQY